MTARHKLGLRIVARNGVPVGSRGAPAGSDRFRGSPTPSPYVERGLRGATPGFLPGQGVGGLRSGIEYLRVLLRGVSAPGTEKRVGTATCVALTWVPGGRGVDTGTPNQTLEVLYRLVRRSVRSTDVVAKLAADIVCVVLPGQTTAGGLAVGKRLVDLWRGSLVEHKTWVRENGVVAAVVFLGDVDGDESALFQTIEETLGAARKRGTYVVCRYKPHPESPIELPHRPVNELRDYANLAPLASEQHVRTALDFVAGHRSHPHLDYGSTLRVADRSVLTAAKLGISRSQQAHIASAALLRDIGMLWLPEPILVRKGPLNPADYKLVKTHPQSSVRRTESILTEEARHVVMHHHERVDGRGYPRGLRGREIPRGARIVSVADAFEAMLSFRPYRSPLPREEAVAELRRGAGKQFDPEVVDAFLAT